MSVESLFIYLLPVIILTFFVRAFFRLRHPKATGSDVWFHLHAAEEIRKNKHRIPPTLDGFIIRTPFDYPPLLHFMTSFRTKESRERFEPFFGSFLDTCQVIFIFFLALILSGRYELAFISGTLFAFMPILVKADARVFFLSPRPFGQLYASFALILSLLFVWYGELHNLVLPMFFLSIVFLTSKFGAQAMIFIYLILALILFNGYFVLMLLGGMGFAILISKGHYLKVLSGHIRHSRFYRRSLVHKHSWTKQISSSGKSMSASQADALGPKGVAVHLLKNPVVSALAYTPLLLILAVLLLFESPSLLNRPYRPQLLAWILASFIPVLIVSIKPLRFLGEAERYLEYGVAPLCILIPMVLYSLQDALIWTLLFLVFIYSVVLILINYRISVKEFVKRPGDPVDAEEVFQRLNQMPPARLMCIPVTTCFMTAYKTNHQTLFWGGNVPEEFFSSDHFDFIFKDEFPFPSEDIGSLVSRYGITHILVWKQSLDRVPPGYYSGLSRHPKLFENTSYAIHRALLPGEQSQVS